MSIFIVTKTCSSYCDNRGVDILGVYKKWGDARGRAEKQLEYEREMGYITTDKRDRKDKVSLWINHLHGNEYLSYTQIEIIPCELK